LIPVILLLYTVSIFLAEGSSWHNMQFHIWK